MFYILLYGVYVYVLADDLPAQAKRRNDAVEAKVDAAEGARKDSRKGSGGDASLVGSQKPHEMASSYRCSCSYSENTSFGIYLLEN